MDAFTLDEWKAWLQQGCTRLPYVRVVRDVPRPLSWEHFSKSRASVLLESANAGRYTYICDRPKRVIVGSAEQAEIWAGDFSACLGVQSGKPLEVLNKVLLEAKTPRLSETLAMMGGLIGVFGYDVVHTWEKLSWSAARNGTVPLYAMIEPAELFVYDELERKLHMVVWCDVDLNNGEGNIAPRLSEIFGRAGNAATSAVSRWNQTNAMTPPVQQRRGEGAEVATNVAPSFTPEAFQMAVRRVLDYIAAGDTYQVNLSLRTSRPTSIPPEAIYEALRKVNPSPYMGLLRLPDFALVCGSPELLVKLADGVISSRPIAGTRPRGVFETQDTGYSAELFASEKERAEHLMLVDLIRNDIGRVAEYGSVHVKEFMVLERYSHVMHIVSEVEGRLAAGQTWVDVFKAMFPGGTITGCPKIRTMEIIEELEPVGRDYYTGALGWISYAGAMEMNIVIRSMLIHSGVAHVQAGAGIVADSLPERELDEALRKARALWVALENATNAHARSS